MTWPLTSTLAPDSGFRVTVPFLLVTAACCAWMLPTQSVSQSAIHQPVNTIIWSITGSIAGCCQHKSVSKPSTGQSTSHQPVNKINKSASHQPVNTIIESITGSVTVCCQQQPARKASQPSTSQQNHLVNYWITCWMLPMQSESQSSTCQHNQSLNHLLNESKHYWSVN